MNCAPVIEMELRSASRRSWSFIIRLLFAASGSLACLVILLLPNLAAHHKGKVMLVILSYLSLAYCLLAGGFLTADSVSCEKREGTLGLLFLTPLRGMDIVIGKMTCHGLQMFYGLCAIFPVFFLTVLAGGVTWAEVCRIVLSLALSLLLGASVGIFISVLASESRRAIMATLSTIILLAAVPMVFLMMTRTFFPSFPRFRLLPQLSPVFSILCAFDSSYARVEGPGLFWGSVLASFVLSVLLVLSAGLLLTKIFRKIGSAPQKVNEPVSQNVKYRHLLERNPYEWILWRSSREARSLGLLTHAFVLFYALMVMGSIITSHWQEGFVAAFFTALAIHLVTKLRFSVEASRQINLDRQSGALELLLSTTLPSIYILEGHKRALWTLSQKPLILLVALNAVLELMVIGFPETLHMDKEATAVFSTLFLGGIALAAADLATLRQLGLLHGLQAPTHVRAVVRAYCATMLLPWVGMGLVIALITSLEARAAGFAFMFSLWVGGCLFYDWLLVSSTRIRLETDLRRLISEGR